MNPNYLQKLQAIKNRYNPEGRVTLDSLRDLESTKLSYIATPDEYVRNAMSSVDKKYTQDIIQAGNNVKEHLKKKLENVDYEFQGSVMSDTHIRANSDIDLLVITRSFYYIPSLSSLQSLLNDYSLNYSQKNVVQSVIDSAGFSGDSDSILLRNRLTTEETLKEKYIDCDTSKSKCVRIHNRDLRKDVEAVIACYDDDVFSIKNLREKKFRGIRVYEKYVGVGKTDHPFYTIDCINEKSSQTYGRLKKMIRFLKNFMFDSDYSYKGVKTFDINIICYNIETYKYSSLHYVGLLFVIQEQLQKIVDDTYYRDSLKSIDGTERVFYDFSGNFLLDKFNDVKNLNIEVKALIDDIYYRFKNAI